MRGVTAIDSCLIHDFSALFYIVIVFSLLFCSVCVCVCRSLKVHTQMWFNASPCTHDTLFCLQNVILVTFIANIKFLFRAALNLCYRFDFVDYFVRFSTVPTVSIDKIIETDLILVRHLRYLLSLFPN